MSIVLTAFSESITFNLLHFSIYQNRIWHHPAVHIIITTGDKGRHPHHIFNRNFRKLELFMTILTVKYLRISEKWCLTKVDMIFLLNYRTILLKSIHLDTTILSSRVSISCSYSILDIELQNIPRLKQQPCFTVVLIDDFSPKGKNIVSLNLCGSLMFRSIRCHISVIKAFKS